MLARVHGKSDNIGLKMFITAGGRRYVFNIFRFLRKIDIQGTSVGVTPRQILKQNDVRFLAQKSLIIFFFKNWISIY